MIAHVLGNLGTHEMLLSTFLLDKLHVAAYTFTSVQTFMLFKTAAGTLNRNGITHVGCKATVLSTVSAACETCQIHLFLWACPVVQAERGPERWQQQACSRKNNHSAADNLPDTCTMSLVQLT